MGVHYDGKAELMERIERNYADFKADMLLSNEKTIYDAAATIVAVEETYRQIRDYDFDSGEVEYLLGFYNPLLMIASFMEEAQDDYATDVDDALYELFAADNNEEVFPTVEVAAELRQIYGDDVNVELAVVREAATARTRYEQMLKLIYGRNGDCDDFYEDEGDNV